MNKHSFYLLPALMGIALFIAGCGTFQRSEPEQAGPRTFLAGAQVQQAKSLAMGAAATKGWKIENASGNRLSVKRPLAIADAQALIDAPVTAATVAVKTKFNQHRAGVEVMAKATVIADTITAKGEKSKTSVEVTEGYWNELNLSLVALQQSWQAAGWRIAAANQPPPPSKDAASENTDTESQPDATAEEKETADAAAAPQEEAETTAPIATSGIFTPPASDAQVEPVVPVVPVLDRTTLPTPSPITPGTPPGGLVNALPAPNPPGTTGVWAYYVQHAAKAQGCEQLPGGIILQARQKEFELYRVRCRNGYDLSFRCNAGVCNALKEN